MSIALFIISMIACMVVLYLCFYKIDNTDHKEIIEEDEERIKELEQ